MLPLLQSRRALATVWLVTVWLLLLIIDQPLTLTYVQEEPTPTAEVQAPPEPTPGDEQPPLPTPTSEELMAPPEDEPTAIPRGRVIGTVIDLTTGAPAPGILVAVGGEAVTTDQHGNYERGNLLAGTYKITLLLQPGQGRPDHGSIPVVLATDATVVQHLAFRSEQTPTPRLKVATSTPPNFPTKPSATNSPTPLLATATPDASGTPVLPTPSVTPTASNVAPFATPTATTTITATPTIIATPSRITPPSATIVTFSRRSNQVDPPRSPSPPSPTATQPNQRHLLSTTPQPTQRRLPSTTPLAVPPPSITTVPSPIPAASLVRSLPDTGGASPDYAMIMLLATSLCLVGRLLIISVRHTSRRG